MSETEPVGAEAMLSQEPASCFLARESRTSGRQLFASDLPSRCRGGAWRSLLPSRATFTLKITTLFTMIKKLKNPLY